MQKTNFKDLAKKIFGFLLSFSSVCLFHISLAGFAIVYLKTVPIETGYIVTLIITFILMIFLLFWSFRILKDWRVFGSLIILYGLTILLFPDSLLWISHEIFGAVFIVLGNIFMLSQNSIYVFKNKRYLRALLNWKGILFDLFLVVGLTFLGQTILTFVIPQNDVKLLLLAISNTILMTAGFTIVGRRTEYTSFIYILIISIVLSIINIPFMRLMGIPSYLISFSIVYILAAMGLGGALSISFVINKEGENYTCYKLINVIDLNKNKLFLKIYFWITFGLATILAISSITLTFQYIFQCLFSYIGFIALFGYAYSKITFNQLFWKYFIVPFFIWELGCYIFITGLSFVSLIVFLILVPKYWSIICYTFILLESDNEKKKSFHKKADKMFHVFIPFFKKETV